MDHVTDEFIVCNIGHPCQELYAIKDRPRNFYMLGSMGLASSIGLGLALSTSAKVVTLEGDGAMLMNLGSLATVAANQPPNYVLIVIDNQAYGSTGFQPSFTSRTDLASVAKACGLANTVPVSNEEDIGLAVKTALRGADGPYCIVVKTEVGRPADLHPIPMSASQIKQRFMEELSHEQDH
jgi:sulfopyruvate decarboxylase subunit beta